MPSWCRRSSAPATRSTSRRSSTAIGGPPFGWFSPILGAGHHEAAEELTQDVFLKVYQKVGQFRGDAKFSTWLYRIAYNQAVDYRSRARFKARHYGEEVLDMMPSNRPQDDPFATASKGRTASVVKECLAQLPHLYRAVLHQHYWMGMTVREIGEMLSAPDGTVKSYMHRARARIQKLLAEKGISDV